MVNKKLTQFLLVCRDRISLNSLANESTFKLLNDVVQMGVNLQEVLHKAVCCIHFHNVKPS